MITHIYSCNKCGSSDLVKNGKRPNGKQKYYCKACQSYGVLNPSVKYTEERKAEILRAYEERSSMRGIQRTFGVDRHFIQMVKKKPKLSHLCAKAF